MDRQQVAGDEIEPYGDENLIATGFLAAARLSTNEEDQARQRNDELARRAEARSRFQETGRRRRRRRASES